MQMIFTTKVLEGDVYNGGFNQYFSNAEGYAPEMAGIGYKLIGANKLAELVNKAVKLFLEESSQNIKFYKEGTAEAFSESYKHTKLGLMDKEFYRLDENENPTKLRNKYIKSHVREFEE